MDVWLFLAFQVVAVLSGAVTAGVCLAIGGLGGLRALQRRVVLSEHRVEDVDERISREVKTRAGQAGVEARKGTAKQIAEAHQADNPAQPVKGIKPSVVGVR